MIKAMRLKLTLIIMTLLTFTGASSAQAGPWLREKGSTFTAASVAMTYYLDTSSQTYLEYGLTDATTLVGDLSVIRLHNAPESGYATLSIRRALSKPDATSKWAYELGVGVGWIGAETLPHLRTGLSWGRGMEWGDKSGWATIEASAVWDLTYARHIAKIDMTLGIQVTEVTAGMIQLYTAHMFDDTVATIAPSVIFSPKESKFRIQIGTESQLGNLENTAVKLGLWREF